MKIYCSNHPTYEAKREPTAECSACKELWNRTKFKWNTLFGYDDGSYIRMKAEPKKRAKKS